jgi:putative SOS response-associated peptidase YedK
MCGRYTQTHSGEAIAAAFGLASVPEPTARYNIAPTQPISAIAQVEHNGVREASHREAFQRNREYRIFQWGLVPSWSKDPTIGDRLFNARAETIAEKPSFRAAFKRRRCLIIADGFYEWMRDGKKKQPFYFKLVNGNLFGLAGIWEVWEGGDGSYLETCTILTTEPNELMQPIHNRMPVIIHPEDYALWLDPTVQNAGNLQHLLRPYEGEAMQVHPVSTTVNNARNETPDCIEPLAA